LNFLINRQYIVDEILGGAGFPMFSMATPGQPGTMRYNKIVEEFGFTAEGDEEKAIEMITAAMEEAAALPENQGRLVKGDEFWEFDGKPVEIRLLVRVDDPNVRMREGAYVADQLEKAGIKVEQAMWDRVKAITTAYYSNPADYEWNMYTEAWGAGATRRYWEHIVAQMYAPWYGYMPGGANPENWNHESPKLDKYTRDAYYGRYTTVEEYWQQALEGLKIGLEEALRIYVCAQEDFYVANKARFESRFAYGLGDGLNAWMFITGNTEDDILRVTQFSAQGALFMSAWDPIGNDGFNDTYSTKVSRTLIDASMFESPVSGQMISQRANYSDVVTDVVREGETIVGKLEVPSDAVKYNPKTDSWEPVGEGVKAQSRATYDFVFTKWHDGTPMGLNDLLYIEAFIAKWATQNNDNDKEYEAAYASLMEEGVKQTKGWIIDFENETITVYFDYNFPADEARVAGRGAPVFTASAAGGTVCGVSWPIYEAIARLITDGSESGTQYSISSESENEIDLLIPSHVADIKAKLVELKDAVYVPVQLKDTMTQTEALQAYTNAIAFIEEMGHAYVGNGAFILSEYDPESNFMELTANREWAWSADYWMEIFAVPTININDVKLPTLVPAGKDFEIEVDLAQQVYPSITQEPATEGDVEIYIGNIAEPLVGKVTNTGEFKIKVPGSMTKDLSGTIEVIVKAELEGAVPVEMSRNVIFW
jgi:peptide/nickel transport system substrate-binding protein